MDPTGTSQYGGKYQCLIALMKDRILNDEQFAKKYPTTEYIQENVYFGNLPEINRVANVIKSKINEDYQWKSERTGEVFQLMFVDGTGDKKKKLSVNFVNGEATVKLALKEDLTNINNPRYPWLESLAVQGKIFTK